MITTTRLVTPHFSGVHSRREPAGENVGLVGQSETKQFFMSGYNNLSADQVCFGASSRRCHVEEVRLLLEEDNMALGLPRHATRQQNVAERRRRHAEEVRLLLEEDNMALGLPRHATRQQNVEFRQIIASSDPKIVIGRLARSKTPYFYMGSNRVRLSATDDSSSSDLASRFLENKDTFNNIAQSLGGDDKAVSFIEKVLTQMFKADLDKGIGSGKWKESKNTDNTKAAKEMAQETIEYYRG